MPTEVSKPSELRDWEDVQTNSDDDKTERLKVANGWLYRTIWGGGVALVFVPELAR